MLSEEQRIYCKNCNHPCHCDTLVCTDCHCGGCLHEEEEVRFPDWG
jgi:hypothetical protein